MLVLTMKKHDYILIGNNIRVHIEDYITSNSMNILFEVPSDVKVWRGEIYRTRVTSADSNSPHPCESRAPLGSLRITARQGDYVMIGDNIKVQYKGNSKGKPSIGIDAPRDMTVLRKNLYEAQVEKDAAAGDVRAQILSDVLEDEHVQRKAKAKTRAVRQKADWERAAGQNQQNKVSIAK